MAGKHGPGSSASDPTVGAGAPDDDAARRSWPFALLGALIALVIGILIWVFWLSPGEPTVDAPVVAAPAVTTTASPDVTPTTSPTISPTRTSRPSASSTSDALEPSDIANNPIDDAIVGYPGAPLERTTSTKPQDIVKVVQQRLVDLNYVIAVDGIYGARMETVVKTFQKDNGLFVDGSVGRETWAALFTSDGG